MTPEQIESLFNYIATIYLRDEQGNIITKANGEPLKGTLQPSGNMIFEVSDRTFSINPENTRLIPLETEPHQDSINLIRSLIYSEGIVADTDTPCKYFSGNSLLMCAVHPERETCEGCSDRADSPALD